MIKPTGKIVVSCFRLLDNQLQFGYEVEIADYCTMSRLFDRIVQVVREEETAVKEKIRPRQVK